MLKESDAKPHGQASSMQTTPLPPSVKIAPKPWRESLPWARWCAISSIALMLIGVIVWVDNPNPLSIYLGNLSALVGFVATVVQIIQTIWPGLFSLDNKPPRRPLRLPRPCPHHVRVIDIILISFWLLATIVTFISLIPPKVVPVFIWADNVSIYDLNCKPLPSKSCAVVDSISSQSVSAICQRQGFPMAVPDGAETDKSEWWAEIKTSNGTTGWVSNVYIKDPAAILPNVPDC